MGCGHFLVETVNFIVRRLTGFSKDLPEGTLEPGDPSVLTQTPAQIKLSDSQLIRRHVLERCVYGVDRDPFAVELAKAHSVARCRHDRSRLAFARRASSLRRRVDWQRAIRHHDGNPTLRSLRAFDWDREFADVFRESGSAEAAACGFDCVVGNPPYVRIQNLDDALVEHLKAASRRPSASSICISRSWSEASTCSGRTGSWG